MAQVPVYQQTQTTGVAPSFRVSGNNAADTAAANLGGAMANLGATYTQMANKKIEADNQTAVQSAKAEWTAKMTDHQYNENMGMMYTKGANASGTTDLTRTYMKAVTENMLNSDYLKGNKARQKAFSQSILGMQNAIVETAMEHEYKQGMVAAKESTDASITSAKSAFMNNYTQLSQTTDPQGNPITNYASDEALRSALSSQATYDIQQGMPQDAMEENLRQVSSDIISSAIKGAIQNNDFAGANAILNRYGHDPKKMNADTYSALNAAITKAAAPVRARTIAQSLMDNAGGDPIKALEGLSAYKSDPDYDKIRAETKANIADFKAEQADMKEKTQDSIIQQLWGMGSMQQQTSYVQGLVANGTISAKDAGSILERSHRVFSVLHPKSPAQTAAAKESKKWAQYEVNGELANDQLTLQKYRSTSPDDMTLALEKAANTASARMVQYWWASSGGTWNPKDAAVRDEKVYNYMKVVLENAETLAERGYTKQEIQNFFAPKLQQIGLDPQQTFDNWFDWSAMGKQKGGLQ